MLDVYKSAKYRTRMTTAVIGLLLACAGQASAISVQITQPLDGATVSGAITIAGTAADLGSGRVSVSMDGGAFQLAQGTTNWTFAWDTTTVANGVHSITARARLNMSDPGVTHTISVTVQNGGTGLSVTITAPSDGAVLASTFTLEGVSTGAVDVFLRVDSGAFFAASGVASWSHVFEPGSIPDGVHTLTARARDTGGAEVFDSISVSVNTFVPGQQDFAYTSSVDQEPMRGLLYVPPTYTAGGSPTALVCFLHGGGGCGTLPQGWSTELDARRWIYIAPHGRLWALADPTTCGGTNANVCEGGPNPNAAGGCNWCISAAYVDNPFDPMVGPGEQDILDAIDWAVSSFNIDPDRIYLTGFSMGGRGTYQIGLRNPDRFAAIAPLGPASDMYEVFVRRPDPPECKEGMVSDGAGGGQPGDSLITDTFYSITSGRFLIENAFNLPVFHGHGTSDCTACNIPPATEPCMNALNGVCPGTQGPAPAGVAQYRHGFHMLFDTSWSDCHWSGNLCFGHTPTLSELRARHPSGYDWGYVFTNAAHQNDLFFATGGAPSATNEGVPSLANPGELMGMFEFFDTRTLVHSPDTIVYKSYTDTDRSAYWAAIDITTPWQDTPGAIRATRSTGSNSLGMELSRVGTATIDLALAQLQLSPATPLGLSLQPLNEPVYDPALMDAVGPLAPTIVLKGSFSNAACVNVAPSAGSPPAVSFTATTVTIGPVSVTQPLTLAVSVFDYGDFDADGAVSSSDIPPFVDALLGSGAPPACPALADMNRDGSIDGLDISPFVSAIAGP